MFGTIEEALQLLHDADPQKRGEAAWWLANHGDSRAFAALERVVLFDEGSWDDGRDGDTVSSTALRAIFHLVPFMPTAIDFARVSGLLARCRELDPIRRERLASIIVFYGKPFREVVKALTTHEQEMVRSLAWAILRRIDGRKRAETSDIDPYESDDEKTRAAAWRKWRSGMTIEHLVKRYRAEPSARVRRSMAGLWVRRYHQAAGSFDDALAFLADVDPSIRIVVAGHVLGRKRPWGRNASDNEMLVGLARAIVHGPRPAGTPTATVPDESMQERIAESLAELDEMERRAVATGKERFDPEAFGKMLTYGAGTGTAYRRGYYSLPHYRCMADYAAALNAIGPFDDI